MIILPITTVLNKKGDRPFEDLQIACHRRQFLFGGLSSLYIDFLFYYLDNSVINLAILCYYTIKLHTRQLSFISLTNLDFYAKLWKTVKDTLLRGHSPSQENDKTIMLPKNKSRNFKKYLNSIICGDCLELIKIVPDKKIDCIITDPPYGLNKNGIKNDGDLSLFYAILPECYRVLKEDSFFVTFFSTKFLPELFKNNPFTYFWQFILYCPEGSVRSPIGFTKYMSCFVFKKGVPKLVKWKTDIFKDTPGRMVEPDEGFIDHPTPKPKHFIKEIMNMTTSENDLILDPFIGSGSTAVACKQLGRKFIGFEINKGYCQLAQKRVAKF